MYLQPQWTWEEKEFSGPLLTDVLAEVGISDGSGVEQRLLALLAGSDLERAYFSPRALAFESSRL